jgi:hydroxypyruvate reductase
MNRVSQLPPSAFQTDSLRQSAWGDGVTRILAAAVQAVEPGAAVRRFLQRKQDTLIIGEQVYPLADYERIFIVGAGKASAPMAYAAREIVGDYLSSGIVIGKDQQMVGTSGGTGAERDRQQAQQFATFIAPIGFYHASHPVPDERGVDATRRIASLLQQTTERDLVLVLISGGGSALMTLPVEGVALRDVQQLTTQLLRCGASINEVNSLRKHLDVVKGGGLARMAAPATVVTLLLSDVVGNPLDVIASGPTVADSTTFADALQVLKRYDLFDAVPFSIIAHLQAGVRGEVAENPKAGDAVFARVRHVVIGSNRQAAVAALQAAQAEGYHALLLTTSLQGEAREAGRFLAAIVRELATSGCASSSLATLLPCPACIVVGGETTVTLRGDGRGGRNQELALAAVHDMAGLRNVVLVTLATDGNDGPTDAAGAVVTGMTLQRMQECGVDVAAALANNDAYTPFAACGDLLKPGLTRTNVNDLALLFAW